MILCVSIAPIIPARQPAAKGKGTWQAKPPTRQIYAGVTITAGASELLEEAEVVFCEVADVGDVVFSHGESFDAETEDKNHGDTEDTEENSQDTD